ncbi:MATE family efflux transporter [Selenomonas artemidis]|uniref:Probable multidrug resistance protein NorM n=1 Tax=Selenomonas artemidis F0399 TaxID=749551 RepID=E7N4T5_9FIRM|nr:MATE family efflux transporter [Selenomonas artemidis]EFW28816.1 MATE efflux family protein [Selenomonas artemidis F0399]
MNPIARFFALESHLDAGEKQGNMPPAKALYRDYWRVAWPTALEGIFLNLILLADLVMVGSLGIAQAAAIGIVSQPKMLMQMFGKALGTGVTAVTARRKGARDYLSLNSCIKQSLALTVLVYAVLASLGYIYREEILRLMGANDEYIGYALVYFTYLIGALFFKAMSAILTAVQIGIGQTKIILQASVAGNLVNVCLNYVLIFGAFGFPRMEIKGAAIATIIGEAVIFLVLLYAVLRHPQEGVDLRGQGTFAFERKTLTPVLAVGTNSFLEQIFERMGLLVFARLIAELGTVAVGTHHYCIILWDLYYYFGLGMSTASASFAGRKLGEKRRDLARLYMKAAQKSGLIVSLVVAAALLLLRGTIFSAMIADADAAALGAGILAIVAVLIVPQTQAQVLAGTLRRAGDNRFIAQYSLFVSAILRSCIAYVLAFPLGMGLYGIWGALLIDEVLKMLLTEYRIGKGIWLTKEL